MSVLVRSRGSVWQSLFDPVTEEFGSSRRTESRTRSGRGRPRARVRESVVRDPSERATFPRDLYSRRRPPRDTGLSVRTGSGPNLGPPLQSILMPLSAWTSRHRAPDDDKEWRGCLTLEKLPSRRRSSGIPVGCRFGCPYKT